jgi:ABC-type branched-subunit amino acid transport system substrate-binding protein
MGTFLRSPVRLLAGLAATGVLIVACSNGGKSRSPAPSAGSSSAARPSSVAASSAPNPANKASAPGITATTITIGGDTPLTGSAAPGNDEIALAANAYFSWVNDHGGIYGRKIVYTYLDDANSPSYAVSVVRQLVERGGVFAEFNGFGTPTHLAVRPFLNTNKVPDLFVASGCSCWNDPKQFPYTFGFQPDYTVEGEIQGQYIEQYYPGKTVGYLLEADEFGHEGEKGLDMEVATTQIVSRQTYDPATPDVGLQISALQAAGAQVVVAYSVPAVTARALIAAQRLGFHPAWVVSNVGSDPTTLKELLPELSDGTVTGSTANGVVTDLYLTNIGDPSNPWTQLWQQVRDAYIPTLPMDGYVDEGMAAAYTFVEAMFAAGQDPTRDDVIRAIENSHFSGPGLTPFSFSSSNHQGYSGVQMGTIEDGAVVLTGTPLTATDTGGISPYTAVPSTPPADGVPTGS